MAYRKKTNNDSAQVPADEQADTTVTHEQLAALLAEIERLKAEVDAKDAGAEQQPKQTEEERAQWLSNYMASKKQWFKEQGMDFTDKKSRMMDEVHFSK